MATRQRTKLIYLVLLVLIFLGFRGECEALELKFQVHFLESKVEVKPNTKSPFSLFVTVPEGHHAYINKGDEGFYIPVEFDFKDLAKGGYKVEVLRKPEGEREDMVKATVLRGDGEYRFSIMADTPSPMSKIFQIGIQSQICNDITKICFPPKTEAFPLPVSFVKGKATTLTESAESPEAVSARASVESPREEGEGITGWLLNKYREYSRNFFIAFIFMVLAGILSAATPCVYPLLPITSAILMRRGGDSREEGVKHSLFYFVGIIAVYMVMGYMAGMTGGALNTIMRSAAVNILFAAVFALLALSMFDFYDFSFAADFQAKMDTSASSKSGYTGTFFMGMVAGLVVSPCVGPVVFALLLQVADRIAELNRELTAAGTNISLIQKTLIAGKGGILMGGFGIGIGIPFLLVGLFSNKMPTAGTWMVYVKYLLGLAILYFAFLFYMKGMGVARVSPEFAYGILAGLAALFASVYFGLFKSWKTEMSANEKLKKALSIISLVFGVYFLFSGLSQSGLLSGPSMTGTRSGVAVKGKETEKHGNLIWGRDFEKAKARARTENKPIFMDFYADWCANCVAFQKLSLSNEELNKALKKVVLLKIYDTDAIFKKFQEDPKYVELKTGLPFFVILNSKGDFFWKSTQYDAVKTMKKMLESAGS